MPCRHRRKRLTKGAGLIESRVQNVLDFGRSGVDLAMPLNARRGR